MNTPHLFHTMTQEERQSGYQVSDSEVVDAIRVLEMYAEQVKNQRTHLYFGARKDGNEEKAAAHLKRWQSAEYMRLGAQDMKNWYNGTK